MLIAVAVWVVTTTVLVAHTSFAAFITHATVETRFVARMGSELSCALVSLPDIEFITANSFALDISLVEV